MLIVAEIGNNHEGDLSLAKELIRLAAESGVDAVKFQAITPEALVSPSQMQRIEQLRRFQLKVSDFAQLRKAAKKYNLIFLVTPFDINLVEDLEALVPAYKIASGDNNFLPLIQRVCETGRPIILSAGLTEMKEIRKTVLFIKKTWRDMAVAQDLAVLHCVSSYPVDLREANLAAIKSLKSLGVTVGYSDHTSTSEAAVLAVVLGARIIEKHFTISKNYSDFRDHALSADPKEMKDIVERIRLAESLLGDGIKKIGPNERKNLQSARRCIVASHDLRKGSVLAWNDIAWLRPCMGLVPGQETKILGKTLKRPMIHGEPILLRDVQKCQTRKKES